MTGLRPCILGKNNAMLFKVYHIGKDTVSIHSTTSDINCDYLAKLVDVDFLHYEVTITPFVFSIL